ncbi:hypothetical protein BG004_007010 [Podila humilis]|nr:hypothetical protein BG004_007010 [Podila humilis]
MLPRPQSNHMAVKFTVTEQGQLLSHSSQLALPPLTAKPGHDNKNGPAQKSKTHAVHLFRTRRAIDDKENHPGKIALQQQKPLLGKSALPGSPVTKYLHKQSIENNVIAPVPSKGIPPNPDLTPNATKNRQGPAGAAPTKGAVPKPELTPERIAYLKENLPEYVFYFDASVEAASVQSISKQLERLKSRVTRFYSAVQVTHIITAEPIPDQEASQHIKEQTPSKDEPMLHKAIRFGCKVWSLTKVNLLMTHMLGDSQSRKNEAKDLKHMLLHEKTYGLCTTQTDSSSSPDFHVFQEYYVLVEDTTGKHQTIVAHEFPKNGATVEQEYPRFFIETTHRTPFVLLDRKKVLAQEGPAVEPEGVAVVAGEDMDAHAPAPTPRATIMDLKPTPHIMASGITNSITSAILPTTSVVSTQTGVLQNVQDRAVEELGKRVLQATVMEAGMAPYPDRKPRFVHPGQVQVERKVSTLNPGASRLRTSAVSIPAAPVPPHPMDSKQGPHGTTQILRPPSPPLGTPHLARPVSPTVNETSVQQNLLPFQKSLLVPKIVSPELPVTKTTGTSLEPKIEEETWDPKKHPYCENCRVGYIKLSDHVRSHLHVKLSQDNRRFASLDLLLAKVARMPKPVVTACALTATCEETATPVGLVPPLSFGTVIPEPGTSNPGDSTKNEGSLEGKDLLPEPGSKLRERATKGGEKTRRQSCTLDEDELSSGLSRMGVGCSADETNETMAALASPVRQGFWNPDKKTLAVEHLGDEDIANADCSGALDERYEHDHETMQDTVKTTHESAAEETIVQAPSASVLEKSYNSPAESGSVVSQAIPRVERDVSELPFSAPEYSQRSSPFPTTRVAHMPKLLVPDSIASQLETDRTLPDVKFLEDAYDTYSEVPRTPETCTIDDPEESVDVAKQVTTPRRSPRRRRDSIGTERSSPASSDADREGSVDSVCMVRSPSTGRGLSSKLREKFNFGNASILLSKQDPPGQDDSPAASTQSSPILKSTPVKRKLEGAFAQHYLIDDIPPPSTTLSAIPDIAPSLPDEPRSFFWSELSYITRGFPFHNIA